MTREQAHILEIGPVLDKALKRCSSEEACHLHDVYKTVVSNYTNYVNELGGSVGVGACGHENSIQKINSSTPLQYFINISGR